MSIRQSLLAILVQGPCYGYQLRGEFDRRTGSTWPLNVGQVYNTLDRLVRDKLVEKRVREETARENKGESANEHEHDRSAATHMYYTVTKAGQQESERWLLSAANRYSMSRTSGARDELALKIALAVTLPGVNMHRVIDNQRHATKAALDALSPGATRPTSAVTAAEFAESLVAESMRAHADAELDWLDHVEEMLLHARLEGRAFAFPLSTAQPKRGRPTSNAAANKPLRP